MPRCSGSKPDGSPCERIVGASQRYCSGHDPARKEARKKAASKAARSKGGNRELRELRRRLFELGEEVLDGRHDPRRAAVAVQAWNAAVRTLEQEHRVEYDRRAVLTEADALRLRTDLEAALRRHVKDRGVLDMVGQELEAIYGEIS